MKPNSQNLAEVLSQQVQYVVPVFQRFYRWEQPQWEKLWENLMELRNPESHGQHFMGFLVFVPETVQFDANLHVVIDGQQRLTTLSLLLVAIRNAAQEKGFNEFAGQITEKYLRDHKGRHRIVLKLRDRQEYESAIKGEDGPDGRITRALSYFESKLAELSDLAEANGFWRFLDLAKKLEFMCATLDKCDKPYNIFKSLNSTGVPLGAADLIRNFVFMNLATEKHDAFDLQLWTPLERRFTRANGVIDDFTLSAFMRDFLMKDGRYVRRENVFETFEDRYSAIGFSPEALAAELNRYADYYMVIRGERFDHHTGVSAALEGINALKVSTTYPLLLHLFERRTQGALSDADLARAIQLLVGFVLRRYICGLGARGYGQTFTKACTKLGASASESLEPYLLNNGYPDDMRFKGAFVSFNLYDGQYCRFMLESIEKSRGHLEPAALAGAEIEHIMPQALTPSWRNDLGPQADHTHATWLHTPGNLTLSAYNAMLANSPFSEKRLHYSQSNIGITRELANFGTWGEAEIRQRGEAMATAAAGIWIGPTTPFITPGGAIGIREMDPEAPDDLGFTNIVEGNFGPTRVSSWRELMHSAVKTSSQRGLPLSDLHEVARAEDHDPGARGFRKVDGENLWVPGMEANQCWRRSFQLAKMINTEIKVLIEWEDREEAEHPSEKAMLRWSPLLQT